MVHLLSGQRRVWFSVFTISNLALFLLGLLLLLSSCGSRRQAGNDPFGRYRPAMKAEFADHLDELELAPRYDLNVTFDPESNLLQGTATILLYNTTADPWRYLMFRLYPALKQYGGAMQIQGVVVNGRATSFVYDVGDTALKVNLPQVLEKGQRAEVRMTWSLETPVWTDDAAVYGLFGRSQQMVNLPLFYPSLAVYVPGATLGAGRWWLDTGTARGDAAYNYTSFFVVTATLPADQVAVTSGTLISSTLIGDKQARHIWVTGPVREFLLQSSAIFGSATVESYGTRVTSYWLPGQEAAGRATLAYAISALRIYSDRFGPYPYRDLRVAPAPINFRGMEYPQAIQLGVQLYTTSRADLEVLVAHEIAHQWWYQLVHNDPVNEPWLDEALAEYSVRIYLEELRGQRDAVLLLLQRWQAPLDSLKQRGRDTLVGQRVGSFANNTQYETVVYGKGALFYDALRDTLGDRAFFDFLRRYLDNHRYGIVDSATWQADLAALNNPAVDALYQEWVSGRAVGQ